MSKRGHTPPPLRFEGDLAYVELTQGKEALIDASDAPLVEGATWCAREGRNTWYAVTNAKAQQGTLRMHRVILGVTDTRIMTDHINGNGLDNRRANLRQVSNQQNTWNGPARAGDYKGVYQSESAWIAQIQVNGKHLHLSSWLTAEDAARAYDQAAREHFGEFALTNFEDDLRPRHWLTTGEMADELGVSKATVQRWADTGRLTNIYVTSGGHRRFRKPKEH